MRTCKVCGVQYKLVGPMSESYHGIVDGVRFCKSLSVCSLECRSKRVTQWKQSQHIRSRIAAGNRAAQTLEDYKFLVETAPVHSSACEACEGKFIKVPAAYRGLLTPPPGLRLSGSSRFCSADCSKEKSGCDRPEHPLRFSYDDSREQIEEKRRLITEGE